MMEENWEQLKFSKAMAIFMQITRRISISLGILNGWIILNVGQDDLMQMIWLDIFGERLSN